jgi:hypothetical protein
VIGRTVPITDELPDMKTKPHRVNSVSMPLPFVPLRRPPAASPFHLSHMRQAAQWKKRSLALVRNDIAGIWLHLELDLDHA